MALCSILVVTCVGYAQTRPVLILSRTRLVGHIAAHSVIDAPAGKDDFRAAASAGQLLNGLLGTEWHKMGRLRVEAPGDRGPGRQQAILSRGRWDRPVSLVTLAFAVVAAIRHHANGVPLKIDSPGPKSIRLSARNIRRIAARLAQRRISPAHTIAGALWRVDFHQSDLAACRSSCG